MLNRVVYLGYYLNQLDKDKFFKFLKFTVERTGKSKIFILVDLISSIFRYNISILEYFQFKFFDLSKTKRESWAGTGYMYEYQLKMNPKSERHILDDKTLFYKDYREFFVHQVVDLLELKNNPDKAKGLLANLSGKIVFKVKDGKCGKDVLIKETKDFNVASLLAFLEKEGYDLVEEFLIQHPDLNRLSPSAVNTIRIFTQLNKNNEVDLLGCRLRISVNSPVDNMAAGNLAAPIDELTGRVSGPGVYSDITRQDEPIHPITNVPIVGFQIPFWNETIEFVKLAAQKHRQNRSIGWDVVITEKGPGLIEGNHDWCKLLWQLPVKSGLKEVLKNY